MRFPSPRAKPGYGKRACQFIDCAAGVAINRAGEAWGVLSSFSYWRGGLGTTDAPGTRPQWLQLSVVFPMIFRRRELQ